MAVRAGYFGKLPSRGDFVRDGLSRGLVRCWDGWLQRVLPRAVAELGPDWEADWDAAPSWLVTLPPAICGPCGWTGVMLPSSDRSGRRFPLLLAVEEVAPHDALAGALERIGRAAIAARLAPDQLRARLDGIPLPHAGDADAGHDPLLAGLLAKLPDGAALARILRP